MIEFNRAGDVMTFECAAFKIEVAGDAERIEFADILNEPISRVTEAFKVLDMMIEHKARQTRGLKVTEVSYTKEAEEAIRLLNEESSGGGVPSRPFIKLEGI